MKNRSKGGNYDSCVDRVTKRVVKLVALQCMMNSKLVIGRASSPWTQRRKGEDGRKKLSSKASTMGKRYITLGTSNSRTKNE